MRAADIAAESGVFAKIINARFVKPLDDGMLASLKEKYIVTVEDNVLAGGFGSLIAVRFSDSDRRVKNFAYCDKFIEHGGVGELMDDYGLNVADIAAYVAGLK